QKPAKQQGWKRTGCNGSVVVTQRCSSTLGRDRISTYSLMSKSLQVSCVQLHWAKDLNRNLERTLHYIRAAAAEGSRVVLFPETTLTGYYFPDVAKLDPAAVQAALEKTSAAARESGIWVIVGTLRKTADRYLN